MLVVIFSDLDGTLISPDHPLTKVRPLIELLEEEKIPLVFCSSKTMAEILKIKDEIKNKHPFISENGGAIFIPKSYFPFEFDYSHIVDSYKVIELGTPYSVLREKIEELRDITDLMDCQITGFGDMTLDQIIEYTNLPRESALLARQRDYDEPFIVEPEECKSKVMEAVRESGFDIVAGGDFLHLTKGCDKGKATTILIHMYHQLEKDVMTIGIGDAENDVPMLSAVDMPVFVGGSNISSLQGLQDVPNLIRTSALGPDGFSEAIEMILEM